VGGDVGTGGGNFTGRDHRENENKVNVYVQHTPPPLEEKRSISVTAEESLRIEIRELRSTANHLADQVARLDKTLAVSNTENEAVKKEVAIMSVEISSVDTRLTTMERLVTTMDKREPIFDPKMLRNIFYSLLGMIALLVIIAYLLSDSGGLG
jgi:chromosome segregation ATPase